MRDVRFNFLSAQYSKSNYAQALAAANLSIVDTNTIQVALGPLFTFDHAPITSGVYSGISCADTFYDFGTASPPWVVTRCSNLDWSTLLSPPNVNVFMYGRAVAPGGPQAVSATITVINGSPLPYRECKTVVFQNNFSSAGITTSTAQGVLGTSLPTSFVAVQSVWVLINNKGVITAEAV